MILKISRFAFLPALVCLLFNLTISNAFAGDISNPYPLSFLSFEGYHVIAFQQDGSFTTRTIKLEVRNTSGETLSNCAATLDGNPDYVTSSDMEVVLGDIPSGETIISSDTFEITIDEESMTSSELKLIWQVNCSMDGEEILDETAVLETLSQ